MTILVTGGTGLLGNNIARTLLERGERVRLLVRNLNDIRPFSGLDVELAQGDVTDGQSVMEAAKGTNGIIHSAGFVRIGWTGLSEARKINVQGTHNVAAAALANQLRMVHVSTVNTLGLATSQSTADESTLPNTNVKCSYVVSKTEAESEIHQAIRRGLQACIVHPGFMLGPWDWKPSSGQMLVEVGTRFVPVAPGGGCSVCDVRDVAAGCISALKQGVSGEHYVLAGHNITYLELWQKIASLARKKGPRSKLGPVIRTLAGTFGDLAAKASQKEGNVNSAAIRMGAQFHYYSSNKAIRDLTYSIRPLEVTMQDAWNWLVEYGYIPVQKSNHKS